MRWLILALAAVWGVLTAFAYVVVVPESKRDQNVIRAYWQVAADKSNDAVTGVVASFVKDNPSIAGKPTPTPSELLTMENAALEPYFAAFRSHLLKNGTDLSKTPALVWSTDDNPARRVQCQLFRAWHLRTFGEPIDIVPDPTNRDITKTIVQCVAGAGPDIIEAYGPAELGQMVSAGVALDVTGAARENGFGVETVWPAAVSSVAVEAQQNPDREGGFSADQDKRKPLPDGWGSALRQYAYPCNVGYTVIFYHRDLFREAGIPEPTAPWNIDQLVAASKKIMATDASGRRVGIMGLGAWNLALWGGNTFYNENQTASLYNNPKTIAGFRAYQDLMYREKVMPTPAEAASMASSGGANMNAGAESASASALFAAKIAGMVSDGRWSYVGMAQRNRDRVIKPAVERRLKALEGDSSEAASHERGLLESGLKSWMTDVLVPISPESHAALSGCLTAEDRARLIDVGVMHVPTIDGTPFYEAAARVAIVNRISKHKEHGLRFLRFLASADYNNQINFTFDSICGVPRFCLPELGGGIKGPPEPLPGLEAFDSPVFVEAMAKFAGDWELSPFIGRGRLGMIAGPIMEKLTNNSMTPEEAAKEIEDGINEQIRANLIRDEELRREWERRVGKAFDPKQPLRDQVRKSSNAEGAESAEKDKERLLVRASSESSLSSLSSSALSACSACSAFTLSEGSPA
ncbi:MAG: ABC transporter substrate-binding protein [Phycisphaerales bacterium]